MPDKEISFEVGSDGTAHEMFSSSSLLSGNIHIPVGKLDNHVPQLLI